MRYYYNLADVNFFLDTPFPLLDNDSTTGFFCDAVKDTEKDLEFIYLPVKKLPPIDDIRYEEPRRIYTGQGETAATFFSSMPDVPPYAWVPRNTVKEGKLLCRYLPQCEKLMNFKKNVVTLMDIEATLLHFSSIILHASLIRWNRTAVVFSAPSGTGKSTQAELWERYEGADILNGDRAALRRKDGIWHGYGLPIAGTSGIYRNEHAPLRSIVALRQAPENSIKKLSAAEAFRFLYPETMIHRWDPEFEQQATALLLEVIEDIPVYLLSCRPDHDAVELLKSELESVQYQEIQI